MKNEPFIAHSEVTDCIYIVYGNKMYEVTDQVIEAMKNTGRLSEHKKGEWITSFSYVKCSECGEPFIIRSNFCPSCGCDMRVGQDERERLSL